MNRLRHFVLALVVWAPIVLSSAPTEAKYFGAKAPDCCSACQANTASSAHRVCFSWEECTSGTCFSRTEATQKETIPITAARSANGPQLNLTASYSSDIADTSLARFDTVLGIGWTHSYNLFLYSVRGHMFRVDADGRITKYQLGPGGTYRAPPGYFEQIVKNADGSFTITQKDQTAHRFEMVSGTSFMPATPVWRLKRITDRNNNVTTLDYSGGNLISVTDTYGRRLTFTYNAQKKIHRVIDPLLRTTTFTYDATGTQLLAITDPAGRSVQYAYNFLWQITDKADKDARIYRYSYTNQKPTGFTDSTGAPYFSLSNPLHWATDETVLARDMVRQYIPSTTTKTDGRGNVWRYEYDQRGYVTRMIAPDGATWTYTYDPVTLMPATETDANGNATRYEYDARGNLIKKTDAVGVFDYVTTYTYEPVFNQMTSMTDANGRTTSYSYDARGNRIQETDPLLQTREWTYDSRGNVVTEKDKRGTITRFDYDGFGNRTRMTEALGKPEARVTDMTYDVVGNLKSRTDANNHTTKYFYDALDRLIEEIDPAGKSTIYRYDHQGNRTHVIDREVNTTEYHYDQRNRLIQITDALKQTIRYTYDNNNNRLTATDKNNHTTNFEYDLQNRLITTTDAERNVSRRKYDNVGNLLTETDANKHITTYIYDALNRRKTRLDAENNLTEFEYDRIGIPMCRDCTGPTRGSSLVTRRIDAEKKVTYFTYDALDRLVIQVRKQNDTAFAIDGNDARTRYTYDPNNNRLTMTEPNNNLMTYRYDALNRQTHVENAARDVTITTYDPAGNVKTVTAPNGNVTTFTRYDDVDRILEIDDSVGRVASYTYDFVGNRLTEQDGNNNGPTYKYDLIYRIMQVFDALNQPTDYRYDPVGNLLTITDRQQNPTVYEYDRINRRRTMRDALDNVTEYQYDSVGNVKMIIDAKKHATMYDYDGIHRLVTETYADGGTRTFTYDRVSNLKTRTDQKRQTTRYNYSDLYFLINRDYPIGVDDNMTYDLSGRMLTAQRGDDWLVTFSYDGANRVRQSTQNGQVVSYAYDIPGRTRTVAYPGGRVITERTDLRSRIGIIDDLTGAISSYDYDLGNRVKARTYGNSTVANYTYNSNNWILSLEHGVGSTRIAGFGHDYDKEGNKRFEEKRDDGASSQTKSESFDYDKIYRLIDYKVGTLSGSTVPVPTTQTHYDLDAVGNWNRKIKDGVTERRAHNVVNEIQVIETPTTHESLTHDANGNLAEDGRYRYAYDEENRLTVVQRKSDSAIVGHYQYDALSRRVQKMANPAATPTTTRYFYDGARIAEEQNTASATQATYVYGNYIDEVLTMNRGGQTYYYHQNALWSVEAITNSAAGVVERYSYDAYGLPSVLNGAGTPLSVNPWGTAHSAVGNPWMFTGRQLDEETGIYFYRARYYDAVKGRFLQRDPVGYVDGMNLYAAYFSPNGVDPAGLGDEEKIKAIVALVDDFLSKTNIQSAASDAVSYKAVEWVYNKARVNHNTDALNRLDGVLTDILKRNKVQNKVQLTAQFDKPLKDLLDAIRKELKGCHEPCLRILEESLRAIGSISISLPAGDRVGDENDTGGQANVNIYLNRFADNARLGIVGTLFHEGEHARYGALRRSNKPAPGTLILEHTAIYADAREILMCLYGRHAVGLGEVSHKLYKSLLLLNHPKWPTDLDVPGRGSLLIPPQPELVRDVSR